MTEKHEQAVQSVDDALANLEATAADPDIDHTQDLSDPALAFDLFKADEEIGILDDSEEIDLQELVKSFAEVNDRNTSRLANAVTASLNLNKSLSVEIVALTEQVKGLTSLVEQIGGAPQPAQGARNVDEAEKLAKGLETTRFQPEPAAFENPEEGAAVAHYGGVKEGFIARLQDAFVDDGDARLGDDLMKAMNIVEILPLDMVADQFDTTKARKVFKDFLAEASN